MNRALDLLISTLPARMALVKSEQLGFSKAKVADHVAFRITGGIGDLLIGLGPAEQLHAKVGGKMVIYSKWPEIARLFTSLPCKHEKTLFPRGLDLIINVNALAIFQFSQNFKGFRNSLLRDVFLDNQAFMSKGQWTEIADHHPHLDYLLGKEAVAMGLRRWNLTAASLGLEAIEFKRKPKVAYPCFGRPYITIHDGFDVNNKYPTQRATKTWDLQHWRDLVHMIKRQYPKHLIVQLGGPKSRKIWGVDIDRVGNQSFEASVGYLLKSSLHIDGDSGLTHAARIMSVPSIALYGPTPLDFFGYPENINYGPKICGGCWWLELDWVSNCPAKYDSPLCMDSIEPEAVFEGVRKVLG